MNVDEIIRDCREQITTLRRVFPDPQDFDKYAKEAVRSALETQDFDPRVIAFTMKAVFGD